MLDLRLSCRNLDFRRDDLAREPSRGFFGFGSQGLRIGGKLIPDLPIGLTKIRQATDAACLEGGIEISEVAGFHRQCVGSSADLASKPDDLRIVPV